MEELHSAEGFEAGPARVARGSVRRGGEADARGPHVPDLGSGHAAGGALMKGVAGAPRCITNFRAAVRATWPAARLSHSWARERSPRAGGLDEESADQVAIDRGAWSLAHVQADPTD